MTTKQKQIFDKAIEACKKIDEFNSECFTGYPVTMVSNGKVINHKLLNEAYDLAYEVLSALKKERKLK